MFIAVALLLAVRFVGSYAFDDSFIGYAVAKNLASGKGFVFDPGVAFLTTSAPLAPLLYAATAATTRLDVVGVAQVTSLVAFVALGPAAYGLFRAFASRVGAILATLTLITSPFVTLLWSHESLLCLVAALIGGAAYVRGRLGIAAVAFAVATLLRQEALIFAGLATFATLRTRGVRAALAFGTIAMSGFIAWTAYALVHFGTVFSSTMAVKIAMGQSGFFASFPLGLSNYISFCFFREAPSYFGAVAVYATVLLAFAANAVAGRRLPPAVEVVVLGCLIACVTYVALGTAFFPWFCLPIAMLVAIAVALPWVSSAGPSTRRPGGLRNVQVACSVALVALHVAFGVRIASGMESLDSYVGAFPGARFNESGLANLGKLFARTLPADASILYPEPGQLRYFSDRTVIDSQGLTHPGVVDAYRRGHPEWTIERYRPTVVVEDVTEYYPHASWFERAYARDPLVVRVASGYSRSHFRIYRLRRPEAIPAPPHIL